MDSVLLSSYNVVSLWSRVNIFFFSKILEVHVLPFRENSENSDILGTLYVEN